MDHESPDSIPTQIEASTKTRCPDREPRHAVIPVHDPVVQPDLNHLADRIRGYRSRGKSRWRRLTAGRQALLALAHLRNGDTYTRLAVAYAILDGTLIPIDRVADQKPCYSGKHKRHGVNVQVIADAVGRLVWASPALPGAIHDLTAARTHAIIDALSSAAVMTFAEQGLSGSPRQRAHPVQAATLPRRQKAVNRAHAKIRARGERAIATLKTWMILVKLRCCQRRSTAIVQAVLVLHHVEANRYAG
jgi:hypothetical protein